MSGEKVATLEFVITNLYVVRVVHEGEERYLGFDAMGCYLPKDLHHAHLFEGREREKALNTPNIQILREKGATINWLRVHLCNTE